MSVIKKVTVETMLSACVRVAPSDYECFSLLI